MTTMLLWPECCAPQIHFKTLNPGDGRTEVPLVVFGPSLYEWINVHLKEALDPFLFLCWVKVQQERAFYESEAGPHQTQSLLLPSPLSL